MMRIGPSFLLYKFSHVGDRLLEGLPSPVGERGIEREASLLTNRPAASAGEPASARISGKSRW